MKTNKLIMMLMLMATPITLMAQNENNVNGSKRLFTLDDLIPGGSTYYQHSYTPTLYLTWWGEECVNRDLDFCSTIDKQTGEETQLFTLDEINRCIAPEKANYLYLVEFPYPEQTLVLVTTTKKRVLVDWKAEKVVWQQNIESGASGEDWNRHSRNLAFVKEHNLYVTDADNNLHTLSTDGSNDIRYGESVHRDEFGITKGTFWNNDGTLLAFYRMDQSMVSSYPQVNVTPDFKDGESRCATMIPDKYPMSGETSHKVSVGIYNVAKKTTVYLNTGDPTNRYFTNIAWSNDGKQIFLIELNRDQNHAHLDCYDVETGNCIATLFDERNDKYVEPEHPIVFLPWNDSQFVYQTRNRDGYNHLFLYEWKNGKAKQLRQLTSGKFEVLSVLGFNRKAERIVFASNEQDPIGCTISSVDMKGHRTLLSNQHGWHNGELSDGGEYISDNWSWGGDSEYGRMITLLDAVRPTKQNSEESKVSLHSTMRMQDPWNDYQVPEMKVGTIKAADGVTDLYYRLTLPTNFDPNKKYPTVVYVYGGPHAHNIDASRHWGVRGWDIWMAQRGYVMFCLDNRGSENRGLEFEQATFRNLGVDEMKDQMCGIDYLRSLPYVDADRIGVHGWSYGGYMTTSLMTTYPETFKVGVAGGPVIDWKYYEVMYGERYMDTPEQNPEGFKTTSLLGKAHNLQGRLLIIYGGNDPTCVPQHTLSFIRACIDAGTHPDLFTYPGDGHNMMGTDRIHLHEHITRYFDDFLK